METKNIFNKLFTISIFIAVASLNHTVKAQNNSLKDSTTTPGFTIVNGDTVYTKVEKPATFLMGLEGWKLYLEHNLVYPKKAQRHGTQGKVNIELTVDKNGNVRDVKALNSPGDGLAEEAVRVLQYGPIWQPAQQNGINVTYRFVQSLIFQL